MDKEQSFGDKIIEIGRTMRILLELKIEDEKIKQILVKYYDLRYSQATSFLEEEKAFFDF